MFETVYVLKKKTFFFVCFGLEILLKGRKQKKGKEKIVNA